MGIFPIFPTPSETLHVSIYFYLAFLLSTLGTIDFFVTSIYIPDFPCISSAVPYSTCVVNGTMAARYAHVTTCVWLLRALGRERRAMITKMCCIAVGDNILCIRSKVVCVPTHTSRTSLGIKLYERLDGCISSVRRGSGV